MDDFIQTYKVYVRTDDNGIITAINSTAFFTPSDDWIKIDEGCGDEFQHAQHNYFSKPLVDANGIYNYMLINGDIVERTDEDKTPELYRLATMHEIAQLKQNLNDTDYIAAKIAEGAATREEYADKLAERAAWRARINELQALLT